MPIKPALKPWKQGIAFYFYVRSFLSWSHVFSLLGQLPFRKFVFSYYCKITITMVINLQSVQEKTALAIVTHYVVQLIYMFVCLFVYFLIYLHYFGYDIHLHHHLWCYWVKSFFCFSKCDLLFSFKERKINVWLCSLRIKVISLYELFKNAQYFRSDLYLWLQANKIKIVQSFWISVI